MMYTNEEIIKHILSELQKYKCSLVYGKDKPESKWRGEEYAFKGNYTNQNMREILPNEIIIEFDEIGNNSIELIQEESNNWIDEVKSWLEENNYSFYITNHGGKSSHIRFQIDKLEEHVHSFRKQYKLLLVKQILNDIDFTSNLIKLDESLIVTEHKLLSLELQPHFKSKYNNTIEEIIYIKWEKVNQIESRFIQMIQKNQHKSNMKQINKKFESNYVDLDKLKDYFEKHYIEGNRNHLVLALGGMLSHKDFSVEEAEDILLEILESISEEDYDERIEQIKYSFDSDKAVGIRPWLKEVWHELSDDEQEEKYQEFKQMFEISTNKYVQVKSGKFYIHIEDKIHYLKYVDDETQTISMKPINHFNNLNKFKTFNTQNDIELDDEPKRVWGEIIKLNKLIKVNKDNIQNSIDSFFTQNEFFENNQLFYNNEFAYTMCNEEHTMLITFDKMLIIDDNPEFLKLPIIRSNLISPIGLKKLKEKQVNENIFDDVKELLNQYLDYDEEDLLLKTLWVFHTYLFNVQGSTVYLHFTGLPGTGKSTAQKVLNQICWNSEYCCNLSESSLFREIDALQNTLHLDEVDKWPKDKQESIQGLLNNGYSKGGVVKRVSGSDGNFKVEKFRVFSPKTLTSNNPRFLDSFKTRCIDIIPQRTIRNLKNIDVLSDFDKLRFRDIRDDIYIYMLKYGSNIFDIFKKEIANPTRISNRENQLLSVLDCFNIHFNLNIDLNTIMDNRKDEIELEFNHYYLILKTLAKGIENGMCIVTADDLVEKLNKMMYGTNIMGYKLNTIKIGFRMKNLGFKMFKRQTLNGERKHHYAIPEKIIRQKILAMGYDITIS